MIYVIVSGNGVLRCGETALECTMGDLLFVPRGHPHGFEWLGRRDQDLEDFALRAG
jgi:mannose-6-phosphate isomerase-like protein (cupin superfamily)